MTVLILLLGCDHCPRLFPFSQRCEASTPPHCRGEMPGRVCACGVRSCSRCVVGWTAGLRNGPTSGGWGPISPSPSISVSSILKSTRDLCSPCFFLLFATWNPHSCFSSLSLLRVTQPFSFPEAGYIDSNDLRVEGHLTCQLDFDWMSAIHACPLSWGHQGQHSQMGCDSGH